MRVEARQEAGFLRLESWREAGDVNSESSGVKAFTPCAEETSEGGSVKNRKAI